MLANFIGIPNDDDDFEVAPTQVRKKTSQNSQSSQEKPRSQTTKKPRISDLLNLESHDISVPILEIREEPQIMQIDNVQIQQAQPEDFSLLNVQLNISSSNQPIDLINHEPINQMSNKGVIEEKSKSPIQYTFDDGGYSPNEELKSKKATTEPKKRGRPKKNEIQELDTNNQQENVSPKKKAPPKPKQPKGKKEMIPKDGDIDIIDVEKIESNEQSIQSIDQSGGQSNSTQSSSESNPSQKEALNQSDDQVSDHYLISTGQKKNLNQVIESENSSLSFEEKPSSSSSTSTTSSQTSGSLENETKSSKGKTKADETKKRAKKEPKTAPKGKKLKSDLEESKQENELQEEIKEEKSEKDEEKGNDENENDEVKEENDENNNEEEEKEEENEEEQVKEKKKKPTRNVTEKKLAPSTPATKSRTTKNSGNNHTTVNYASLSKTVIPGQTLSPKAGLARGVAQQSPIKIVSSSPPIRRVGLSRLVSKPLHNRLTS